MIDYVFSKPKRRVERVFLHCTAYPHGDLMGDKLLAAVDSWHRQRGWDKVGYHFLIDRDGELIPTGRSLEENPIAQAGHNSRTIAICLDGLTADQFTAAQFETLVALADQIDDEFDGKMTWHGHCEVSAKACPVFDYRRVLGLDAQGVRVAEADLSESSAPEAGVAELAVPGNLGARTLTTTSRGGDVAWLQQKLGIHVDGIFGQDTGAAVRQFQREQDLVDDGVVGRYTWDVLFDVFGRE